MCLQFSVQEAYILEHSTTKWHLCTLQSTCRPLCNIGIHLMNNTIEDIHAKILETILEYQVSWMKLLVKFLINI